MVKNPPINAGSIPGSGRYPVEGNGNQFQCSRLEKPMDRVAEGLQSSRSAKESDTT